jgi:hypothetical protein
LSRSIFDKDDFTRQNVIAALINQSFCRHAFPKRLDKFYIAIEHAAANLGILARNITTQRRRE